MKPLLLLDVDGPLNPYHATRPPGYTLHKLSPGGVTYDAWLNHDHGAMLLDLADRAGLELAWATTWEHEVREWIEPHLGLPELPVIGFGFRARRWKFGAVAEYAGSRPLAWFDDDFERFADFRDVFLTERGTTPTLLHHVSPRVGLTRADLDTVAAWAAGLENTG